MNMKMLMLVYNEAIDEEVMETARRCGMGNYTKLIQTHGKGATSGTHAGTDIWPGLNNVALFACPAESVARLLGCVRELRAKLGKEGIKAFAWPLDEIT